jgi:hypothetical protein
MDHHVELVRDYLVDRMQMYYNNFQWLMIGESGAGWIYGYSAC